MSGPEKDKLQERIRKEAGDRWSEHTRPLKPLQIGDFIMLQNLKGSHPLKSDYSGEIVGRHNIHSYAVRVQPGGQVTIRNRATLRKIPKPAPVHVPVVQTDLSRPPRQPRTAAPAPSRVTRSMGQGDTVSGNGPIDTVLPPVLGRVIRSMEQGDLVSRQETMNTVMPQASRVARPEGPPGQSRVSGQGLIKQGPDQSSQGYSEAVFDNIMEQVWPVALRKSPAPGQKSHVDDSGESSGQARAAQPVQAASPGGQPAGAGPTLEVPVRSVSGRSSDGINLAVHDSGGGYLVKSPQILAGSSLSVSKEVGSIELRRSGRQCSQLSTYQAGSSGME